MFALRANDFKMYYGGGVSHIGGNLSSLEAMIVVLHECLDAKDRSFLFEGQSRARFTRRARASADSTITTSSYTGTTPSSQVTRRRRASSKLLSRQGVWGMGCPERDLFKRGLPAFVPRIAPQGVRAVLLITLIFGSFNLFAIGLVGEYVHKIATEVEGRSRLIRASLIRNGEQTELLPDGKAVALTATEKHR